MNKELQRIAIAEACGWTRSIDLDYHNNFGHMRVYSNKGRCLAEMQLPDYIDDLNAINQAEQTLLYDQRKIYAEKISFMLRDQSIAESFYELMYLNMIATAAQRAEAFLKTIGKWEQS